MIEQALYAAGRSIFIYGDRGVGKTSLAQTVAYSHQSSGRDPVLVACDPQTTFSNLMAGVLAALQDKKAATSITINSAKLGYRGLGLEVARAQNTPSSPAELDLNGIVAALLRIAADRGNEDIVVVIDEFDRITSDPERDRFADFIKQIGDQRMPVKFVFCGVSDSMQKLLGAHDSCFRCLDGIELQRLSWDARYEIIDAAATALGVTVSDRPRFRIAGISDGFPHYVHRLCEHLFWQMFNDEHLCETPTINHYRQAVAESVLGIEQHLRATYERAVMKDAPGYKQVLWAMADHADLFRSTESIYESYLHLFGDKDKSEVLDRQTVVTRLNALKSAACGQIVVMASQRRGWYQFRESIMRGYVRLRAEEEGHELILDYSAASHTTPALGWRNNRAKRGPNGLTNQDD